MGDRAEMGNRAEMGKDGGRRHERRDGRRAPRRAHRPRAHVYDGGAAQAAAQRRATRTRGGLLECELLRGAQLGAQFRQALVGSALARRGDARACFSLLELLDVSSLPCSGTICGDPSHEGLTCSIRPGCCFRPSRRSRSPLCTGAPEPTRLPIRTSMPLVRSVGRLGLPSRGTCPTRRTARPPRGTQKTRSTPSRDDGVERSTLMHMLQVLRCSCSCSCSSHVLMLLLLLLLPLLRLMA